MIDKTLRYRMSQIDYSTERKQRVGRWMIENCLKKQIGRLFLLCIFFIITSKGVVSAQSSKQEFAKLQSVFQKLQQLPEYQYETETNAIYPNGTKDKLSTLLCVNRKEKELYYQTNNQILIINKKWIYNADLFNKTVSILSKRRYAKYKDQMPNPDDFFDGKTIGNLMDSTILNKAVLKDVDHNGDLITYKLGFAKGSYFDEFVLVYNSKTELPQLIRFRVKYNNGKNADGSSQNSIYETICKNYKVKLSDEVFDTKKYFYVKDGKVKLLKYKNFKVSAVL